jgi:prophage antirepressor-like protein/phage antirepressor YoqD-like protein
MGIGEGCPPIWLEDGKPWWVCKDLADYLGYKDLTSMTNLFAHVPDFWKGRKRIPTLGGPQQTLCVNKRGLFDFLGRSDKPKARPYQLKVAGEIMPAIQETGAYIEPGAPAPFRVPTVEELVGNRALVQTLLRAFGVYQDREDAYLARIAEDAPMAEFARAVMEANSEVSVRVLAAYVFQDGNSQSGRNRMFGLLKKDGWAYKEGGIWVPSQKAEEQGLLYMRTDTWFYSDGRSGSSRKLKVTPKGQVKFVWLYGKGKPVGRAPATPLPWAGSLAARLKLIK